MYSEIWHIAGKIKIKLRWIPILSEVNYKNNRKFDAILLFKVPSTGFLLLL